MSIPPIPPPAPATKKSLGITYASLRSYLQASYRQARWSVMTSPPAITKGTTAVSSVNSSYTTGVTLYQPDVAGTYITPLGSEFTSYTPSSGITTVKPAHVTSSDGVTLVNAGVTRYRWRSDAPEIDLCFLENSATEISIAIDGELTSRSRPFAFANSGNYRYMKVSFGSDVVTYSKSYTTGITTGGTGYAVNDLITVDGGSGGASGTGAVLRVAQVSSGAVVSVWPESGGSYTSLPTGTLSQVSTTGSGSGATFSASFFEQIHSTRKMRTWELFVWGPSTFIGVVPTSNSLVIPDAPMADAPKLVVIGDSIQAGTYLDYGAGHIATSIAQRLGLDAKYLISAQGGTGWNTSNQWSSSWRIADLIRYDADIYLFIGSQNDTSGTALTTAVTTTLNQLLAANSRCLIVGFSNVVGASTAIDSSISSGFAAASDQNRVRYISTQQTPQWLPSSYASIWTLNSDNNHLTQVGQDRHANLIAPLFYDALMQMTNR